MLRRREDPQEAWCCFLVLQVSLPDDPGARLPSSCSSSPCPERTKRGEPSLHSGKMRTRRRGTTDPGSHRGQGAQPG